MGFAYRAAVYCVTRRSTLPYSFSGTLYEPLAPRSKIPAIFNCIKTAEALLKNRQGFRRFYSGIFKCDSLFFSFKNKLIKAFLSSFYKDACLKLFLCNKGAHVGYLFTVDTYATLLYCAAALRL